jgi:hypothetical protein
MDYGTQCTNAPRPVRSVRELVSLISSETNASLDTVGRIHSHLNGPSTPAECQEKRDKGGYIDDLESLFERAQKLRDFIERLAQTIGVNDVPPPPTQTGEFQIVGYQRN